MSRRKAAKPERIITYDGGLFEEGVHIDTNHLTTYGTLKSPDIMAQEVEGAEIVHEGPLPIFGFLVGIFARAVDRETALSINPDLEPDATLETVTWKLPPDFDFARMDKYEEVPATYTRDQIEVGSSDQRSWIYIGNTASRDLDRAIREGRSIDAYDTDFYLPFIEVDKQLRDVARKTGNEILNDLLARRIFDSAALRVIGSDVSKRRLETLQDRYADAKSMAKAPVKNRNRKLISSLEATIEGAEPGPKYAALTVAISYMDSIQRSVPR